MVEDVMSEPDETFRASQKDALSEVMVRMS